jgi:hypothetical protein
MMEITRRGREGNWFRFLGSSWGTAPFQAPFSVSFFLPSFLLFFFVRTSAL